MRGSSSAVLSARSLPSVVRTALPALLLSLLCSSCCLLSTPRTGTVEHELEMFVFGAVNCHRAQIGLDPLEWSESVAMVCRGHCRDMSSGSREIGHGGMDFRVMMVELMLNVTSYRENVSAVQGGEHPASCAYMAWLDSRIHRRNIEGEATSTGVGALVAENGTVYFVQIFVDETSSSMRDIALRGSAAGR